MLSGIGLEEELAPFGIPVREQLPVGRDLQDHFMANLNFLSTEPALFGIFTPENFELLHREGRGPLSSNLPEAGGFFRTRPDLPAPDVEFHFSPSLFYDEGLTAPHDHGYVFGPVLVNPVARGKVTLRTPMAESKPCVVCNFLTTEEDSESFVAGHADRTGDRGAARAPGRRAGALQRAALRFGRRTSSPAWTTCRDNPSITRPRPVRWGRSSTPSCASTGSTGSGSSTPRSCRPSLAANTHAPTMMIAEKAADLILGRVPLAAATA